MKNGIVFWMLVLTACARACAEPAGLIEERTPIGESGLRHALGRRLRHTLRRTVDGIEALRWREGERVVAEGARVEFPGLVVTRLTFKERGGALAYAGRHVSPAGRREELEVRGEHLLLLTGNALDERGIRAAARQAAWEGLAERVPVALRRNSDLPPRAELEGLPGGPASSCYAKQVLARHAAASAPATEGVPAEADVDLGTPGEYSRHGLGEARVTYADGSQEELSVFASRLSYSGRVRAWIVPASLAPEDVSDAFADAFAFFGGVSLAAEVNAPAWCAHRQGGATVWAGAVQDLSVEYGFFLTARWEPPFADEPGAFVTRTFFARNGFRFADRADLDAKLADWHRWANTERPYALTGSTPDERFAEERPLLQHVGGLQACAPQGP